MSAKVMADESNLFSHALTLLLGGGGVGSAWAYVTTRREREADRVARFEERMLTEYHRVQDEARAMNVALNETRDAYRREQSQREDATRSLDRAEQALQAALARVQELESSQRDTRALVNALTTQNVELTAQNKLLRETLRGLGHELGGAASEPTITTPGGI